MEEPLPAGGSCLLGALNVSAFVKEGKFDFEDYKKSIVIAIRGLNEVLDEGLPKHPLKEQQETVRDWRQIGLGIMGIADMLIKLGLEYGSHDSLKFCDEIAQILAEQSILASAALAREKGTYPKYDKRVIDTPYFNFVVKNNIVKQSVEQYGLHNSQLLTIAPTGTISTMLGISGGIEPIFANSYTRTTKTLHNEDVNYKVFTPIVKQYMEENNVINEKDLPSYFVTARQIPYEQRIKMQSIWQKYIDASISSTINLPESATIEDIADLYAMAWEYGLKGITVYRENCKRTGILNDTNSKPNDNSVETNLETIGLEKHLTTGCGSLHICAYFDNKGNLKNTYLSKGSTGGCNNFMISLSRLISLAARNNVKFEEIIDQLSSCGTCPSYAVRRATKNDTSPGSSCPVAIGNALNEMRNEVLGINSLQNKEELIIENKEKDKCPECGAPLLHEMGCVTCKCCGYSKCG